MSCRDLPEEVKMKILEYSVVPTATTITLRNDPAYLLQELLRLEPKLDLGALYKEARERDRERKELQLETKNAWKVWEIIHAYPNDHFSIDVFSSNGIY